MSGPLPLPSVHRSTSPTCPKAIKQINPPTEAERVRLAGEGRRRQLQVDGCSCSSQVLRASRRAGIVPTPHQGEADTKHTHAPLWQRQEKMLVNISMTSPGPSTLPCKKSAWERFYAARQLPEMAKLLIIRLQSGGIKSCESEE